MSSILISLEALTLKTTSNRPYFSLTSPNILITSSSLLTSPATTSVVVPSRHSLAVECSAPSRLPERIKTKGEKASERAMAHARPIPADAPVIRMTLGVRLLILFWNFHERDNEAPLLARSDPPEDHRSGGPGDKLKTHVILISRRYQSTCIGARLFLLSTSSYGAITPVSLFQPQSVSPFMTS